MARSQHVSLWHSGCVRHLPRPCPKAMLTPGTAPGPPDPPSVLWGLSPVRIRQSMLVMSVLDDRHPIHEATVVLV